ncbi:unnamed protein product, partial [Brachionus calyciflorus]
NFLTAASLKDNTNETVHSETTGISNETTDWAINLLRSKKEVKKNEWKGFGYLLREFWE